MNKTNYTIQNTSLDARLKDALNPKCCSQLHSNRYYVFHTQLDIYICSYGRVTVNPFALCKSSDTFQIRLKFLRTQNVLPYPAQQILERNLTSYVYDITNDISEYGLEHVINILENIKNNTSICEEQHKETTNLRDTIDGELNSIAISDNIDEINSITEHLIKNIREYAEKNRNRIKDDDLKL